MKKASDWWFQVSGKDLDVKALVMGEPVETKKCPKCGTEGMRYESVGKLWTITCMKCGHVRGAGLTQEGPK